jgi:hypothetical protein
VVLINRFLLLVFAIVLNAALLLVLAMTRWR